MADASFPNQPESEPSEPALDDPAETTGSANGPEHPTERDDPYAGAVPPGYDWPTHGGYLGCLIGLVASCLVGGFIGSTLFAALRYDQLIPGWMAGLLTVAVYIGVIVGLGRLGWLLGRRFYREYPQTRGRTWGEHDDFSFEDDAPAPAATEEERTDTEAGTEADTDTETVAHDAGTSSRIRGRRDPLSE